MCFRVEQLTIHLRLASGREARRGWKHGQGCRNTPKKYVLQRKNVILMQCYDGAQCEQINSLSRMDFGWDFELRSRIWTIYFDRSQ